MGLLQHDRLSLLCSGMVSSKCGPLSPVTGEDLQLARSVGLGESHRLVQDLHDRLSDFIHRVVVHRRDVAIFGWRNWLREDPLNHPCKWLRPDLVPPAAFLHGVLADPARIDEEFRKAWLPYFCRSGQRETSLEEFEREVHVWLLLLPEVSLPELTVEVLAEVVHRKGATAGTLDGWGCWEFKALPVSWLGGLARFLSKVEETGLARGFAQC